MLNFKSTNIDPFVIEIIKVVNPLAEYFESITYFNLDRLGYYVIPITLNFSNLSNLNIGVCCLDVKDLNRLMRKLDKLQKLTLFQLDLIKSSDEKLNEQEIKSSPTLKELCLGHNYINSNNLPNTPYEFLVKYSGSIDRREFYLTPQHLPNLGKFELIGAIENSRYITNLLTLTPKLTSLTLPIQNYSIQVMEVLSENSVINQLNLKFNFQDKLFLLDKKLPVLNSLRDLILTFIIRPDQYLQIYQLIEAFSDLTKLEIELKYYEPDFIIKILIKLTKLKVLKLQIFACNNYIIDLTLFSGVEFLKFDNYSKSKTIYKLPDANGKLKTAVLPLKNRNNNYKVELVNELDKINANWVFSLRGNVIHCRSASIKQ